MRVYIGKYHNRIRWPLRVHDWYFNRRFGVDYDHCEKDYNIFDRALIKITDAAQDLINKYINNPWIDNLERKIKVRVDYYDVWSADHTLALIIHPVLLKLKEVKHGSPFVDNEDVPEHLRSIQVSERENKWDVDENYEARWNWVLDEMIWAFEQCTKEDNGEDQFYSGEVDLLFVKDEETGLSRVIDGPKSTFKIDSEGEKAHYARIKNGHRLFGKYYFGLWD
jgi:hypothetical protein